MPDANKYIRWFEDIHIEDVPLVGGKNASLGEMYRELSSQSIKVPNGFAVTAEAYRHILAGAGGWSALHEILDGLDPDDVEDLARRGGAARDIVYNASLTNDLYEPITRAYQELQRFYGGDISVAVRSSATAEDLPNASFAGRGCVKTPK
ncbi:MAG: pyruvate,water dikinase, partial [Gammaproteobacteria bacterium]